MRSQDERFRWRWCFSGRKGRRGRREGGVKKEREVLREAARRELDRDTQGPGNALEAQEDVGGGNIVVTLGGATRESYEVLAEASEGMANATGPGGSRRVFRKGKREFWVEVKKGRDTAIGGGGSQHRSRWRDRSDQNERRGGLQQEVRGRPRLEKEQGGARDIHPCGRGREGKIQEGKS